MNFEMKLFNSNIVDLFIIEDVITILNNLTYYSFTPNVINIIYLLSKNY